MECDLCNPWTASPFNDAGRWQHLFELLLRKRSLAALEILDADPTRPTVFDRLHARAPHVVEDGPLVSVIITSWKPGPGLRTAVESMLAQSWRNLEILLVDDASPAEYGPLLQEVAALDPRIRLLVQPRNGGTYLARNAGLEQARGVFVTGQDSDDWAHPLRIELQARCMLANPGLVTTLSHALRCDHSLVFNAVGSQVARENASSLMFRREPVLARVGGYDAVRKAGDTEFMLRIRCVFGKDSHHVLPDILALIRRTEGSLSNTDFRPGWRHSSRWAYRRNYEYWHALDGAAGTLKLDGKKESPRRFPAPLRFLDNSTSAREQLDVVFVDDLRRHTDERHLAALHDEVYSCVAAGLRVGLAHIRSFRDITQKPIDPLWRPLQAMVHKGQVREVLLGEQIDTSVLIVRRPEVLVFADGERPGLHAKRVVMVAEEPPEDARGRIWYQPEICEATARMLFEGPLEWAMPAAVARLIGARVTRLSDKQYPVIADLSRWRTPRRSFVRRRPVIGRVVENLPGELPQGRSLLAAYPQSDQLTVRFLNGRWQLEAALGQEACPANWIIHGWKNMEYASFLSGCDFYVHFDGGERAAAPVRIIAHALAAGCVVILPPDQAARYGDAVIAARRHEVESIVLRLAADAGEFRDQVERGRRYLEKRHGGKQIIAWLHLVKAAARARTQPVDVPAEPVGKDVERPLLSMYRDYVDRALSRKDSTCLDDTIRRTGSLDGRELFAYAMSDGRTSLRDLMQLAESYRSPHRRNLVTRELGYLDPKWVIRLARTMALQNLLPGDRLQAMTLLQAMLDIHGHSVVPKPWSTLFVDTAIAAGRPALAGQLAATLVLSARDRQRIAVDLANPALGGCDEEAWLSMFNEPFLAHGLEPVCLMDGNGARFDRICVHAPAVHSMAAKVTVVVTAWQPDEGLLTAVRSLLAQTWTNLEIIIVDDASPIEFRPLFDACLELDPRIKVIRHATNQGTYAARNTAMEVATGEFLTFQDSDDFSHPRRIELQLQPLLDDGSLMATKSDSIRVSRDLVMAVPGSGHIQGNASSLLFRLQPVKQRIGYFDRVRKAADTEYAKRIAVAFGVPVLEVAKDVPLALIRLDEGSLSRSEFKPGWRHPARTSYREAYEFWHEMIADGRESPWLPATPAPRRFPVPQRFALEPELRATRNYDVVFVGDWRRDSGPQKSMLEEIQALRARGFRVAIAHLEAFRFMTKVRRPLSPQIRGLIHEGAVDELVAGDDARVNLVILRYPPILQFTPAEPMGWKVGKLMIVANQAPSELDGSDLRYYVSDCARNARHLFGLDAIWAPQGPQVRRAIEMLMPAKLLAVMDVTGILQLEQWAVADRQLGEVPVIGRYSRDNLLKFPASAAELLKVYPDDPGYRVRIMGGTQSCPEILGDCPVPATWELIPYGAVPVKEFLASIDFFVYYDNDRIVEAFGRSILEAMASGCVVILPPKFQEVFGDGALYAAPDEVAALVKQIHSNPQRYAELSAKGLDHLKRHFSHASYADRIAPMISAVASE